MFEFAKMILANGIICKDALNFVSGLVCIDFAFFWLQ